MPRSLFIATVVVTALTVITGCARPVPPQRQPEPQPSVVASVDCDASGVQTYIGRSWRVTLNDELLRASRSQVIRVMWPGEPATLELNPARLNVLLDKQNAIQQLYCG